MGTRSPNYWRDPVMYRVRRNFNHWQTRWPWRLFFFPQVNERFCRKCGMPFQDGPMPKEIRRIDQGNIACLVFPAGGYRKKEVVVRFGRWRAGQGKFYLSEFIPTEDLNDLFTVVSTMRAHLNAPHKTRAGRQ